MGIDTTRPCQFFLEGKCGRGKKCRFAHVGTPKPPQPESHTPQVIPKVAPKIAPKPAPVSVKISASTSSSSSSSSSSDSEPELPPQKRKKVHAKAVVTAPSSSDDSSSESEDEVKQTSKKSKSSSSKSKSTEPTPSKRSTEPKRKRSDPVSSDSSSDDNEDAGAPKTPTSNPKRTEDTPKKSERTKSPKTPVVSDKTEEAKSSSKRRRVKEGTKVCRFWKEEGKCKKSDRCTFLHPPEQQGDPNDRPPKVKVPKEGRYIEALTKMSGEHDRFKELNATKTMRRTKGKRGPIGSSTSGFPVVAMDCEMVETKTDTRALARLTVVGLGAAPPGTYPAPVHVIIDKYVKPSEPVVDFRSHVSGITAETFEKEDCITLQEAQDEFLRHVKSDTVLVGHSLHFDLLSLQMRHHTVVDTSMIFKAKGMESQTMSLKDTVSAVLDKDCQVAGRAHDSVEDASWSLELVRYAVDKLAENNTVEVGDLLTIAIPDAILRRMNVFQVPNGATIKDLWQAFSRYTPHKTTTIRPLMFRTKEGQTPLGSTVLTFGKKSVAKSFFDALPCQGAKQDKDGLWQKKVFLDQTKFPGSRHFYVKTFLSDVVTQQPVIVNPVTQAPPHYRVPTNIQQVPLYHAPPMHYQPAPHVQPIVYQQSPQAPVASPRFCTNCGTPSSGGRFCAGCGKPY